MSISVPKTLAICVGVFVMSLAVSYFVAAWTEPGDTPPHNNIAAPVNVSSNTQIKTGNLDILGTVGIGTTSPTQKLDVDGYVKGRTGLCIGDQCCQNWTECVNLGGGGGSCQSNGASCYSDSECCSGACINSKCSPSGSGILPRSACANTLPVGNKRIFITRQAFTGSEITSETNADAKCQVAAQAAGMSNYGKFKALVYWGTRNINAVITTNALFNGKKVGSTDQCDWYRISDGGNDIFTLGTGTASNTNKGAGNYTWSPLRFDENGLLVASGNYWTNFKPNTALNGSYILIAAIQLCGDTWYASADYNASTYPCSYSHGYCPGSMGGAYACCWHAVHWYGSSTKTDVNWSGKSVDNSGSIALKSCRASSHSLICVEGN